MFKLLMAFAIAIVSFGFAVDEAEAARFGGRRSFGMQRQAITPRPAQTAPAAAPGAARQRSLMGPIAGLAAGLGIAALLSHFGFGAELANLLTIGLLVLAAVMLFKWLARRNLSAPSGPSQSEPLRYAGADPRSSPLPGLTGGAAAPVSAANIPPGFDSEAFLRVAKLNFLRLQAANDEKNLDDIREFVSPEVFAEIKVQLDERDDLPQQTDVVTLDAELLEVVTEGNRHIASVHFSGMIRESVGAVAEPFSEVWNLSKPTTGDKGWAISGIQQLS
ncbi:MAG: Tim44-like domain-containing protein [Propionivibrio sp.]